MNRGRRYEAGGELNIKKVIAVIIAIAVIIMVIVGLSKILNTKPKDNEKIISIDYFSVYTNGKWGVINSKGETIVEPTYEEMIQIPNKSKAVFICTYDVDYNTGKYKTKALNEKGQIFSQYELVEPIYNVDENNNLSTEDNILKVCNNGKYGIIDFNGKEIASCQYDEIYALDGVKNSIITVKDNKKGLIDTKGNVIIENDYKNIENLTSKYENGYVVQNTENKYGVINYNKKVALECKYDEIKKVYGDNSYVVKENSKLKIIDTTGNVYLENKYSDILAINDGNAIVKKDNKFGVVSKTGDQKVPVEYQQLSK